MRFDREITLADLAAGVGAIEDGQMLVLQERRTFQRHRTADVDIGSFDVLLREADMLEQVEAHVSELLVGNFQRVLEEVGAERPLVEDELDVEGSLGGAVDRFDLLVRKALGLQCAGVDARSLVQIAVTDRIGFDLGDLAFCVTERAQGFRNRTVDDLEVTAAGKLLELHERKVGFDAGRVAVHDEADRAGRRDNGRLGVAVTVLFTKFQRLVPGGLGVSRQRLVRVFRMIERNRIDGELLVAGGFTVGCAAMVADDPQHAFAVRRKIRERSKLAGHFSRGRIGNTGHDRGQRTGNRTPFLRIVGDTRRHKETADVCVAEAERAVLVGEFGDFLRRELRHHHRHFENDGPQANGMFVVGDRNVLRCLVLELQKVERSKVACRVVEEHVFRARVGAADRAAGRRSVPVVHRRVEVDARIGRRPCGIGNLFPQILGLQGLHDLAVLTGGQVPLAIVFDSLEEVVLQRDGVVGVLARHGEVGFRIPVRVIGLELKILVTLLGELDDALDVVFRNQVLLGSADFALQGRVLQRVIAIVVTAFAVDAGLHDRLQVLGDDLRTGDEGGNLLLFLDLPVDVFLDIRMVDIDNHHLGRATGRAARLDRAGCPVTDLQEAHQAGRTAAAGKLFAFAAQMGEVGAGAGTILEQTCFANPKVHDAAFIDQVVADGLDEAGMRLRMLIGRLGLRQLAGEGVDIEMALAGAIDAIGPMQAGVEPLGGIRSYALGSEHVGKLVHEGCRIVFGREIAALPAPIGPGAGKTRKDLAGIGFRTVALAFGNVLHRLLVGNRTPQEGRNVVFLNLFQDLRNAGLAEILLRQNVGCDLGELRRHVDIRQPEDDGTVRIADLAGRLAELDSSVGACLRLRETTFDAHCL
ncbi:hypothetical protein D3C73_695080 [compost metagenome]